MKKWIMFVCCLALFACTAVHYVPNPNVSDPAKVIERIAKQSDLLTHCIQ
jgi:hypothetical protein